jgi:hippurate hydrolase
MLLGAARHLAKTRNFKGCVHFIFQPAEEGLGGARAMIEDGLFDRFPCESVYAMHNWPGMPVGRFGIRPGSMLAGGVFFDIDIKGRGAHGAFPHQSADPVIAASELTMSLQTIVARRINPVDPAGVSVTRFHAGDAYNVIPESAQIGGTARGFSNAVLDRIEQEVRRVAAGVASAHGVEATVTFRRLFAPVVNAEREAALIADVAAAIVGEPNVNRAHHLIMGSEDFSFMMEARPGAFMLIGNGENRAHVHSPTYDFNDEILPLGAALFVGVAERELAP